MAKPPLKIMISSSVYQAQSLLRQTYATLLGFGYEVICSPAGSLPVNPKLSNQESCLRAVEECDIYIGFIRPIYGVHGRVSVSVYPSRFEIWSYGDLPTGLSLASLKKGDRSLPVNPDIAQVVFLRGLVDLLGRGTRKMVEDFTSRGMPEPAWKKMTGGICLTMRSRAAAGTMPKELNARQIQLLHTLRPGETTTIAAYGESTEGKVSERALRDDLAKLVPLGYFAKQGQGKNTFYVRTEKPA
jgi:ATP-dependent DNA helicase RecG